MFQIEALDPEIFAPLFDLSDAELAARNARRVVAASKPGFPCRVSLEDAEVGETVLLLNHVHQAEATPFRASHAIYVRRGAAAAKPAPGEVPEQLRTRMISLRGFDARHDIVAGDLAPGADLERALEAVLAEPKVDYVHLHYAKLGCYASCARRAAAPPPAALP